VQGNFAPPSTVVDGFPAALEQVIMTALAVDANKRYASAHALYEALLRVAKAEGWNNDGMAITAFMHELYGAVSMFGQVETAEITNSAIVDEAMLADHAPARQPTAIMTRPRVDELERAQPRRLARGTEAEPLPVVRQDELNDDEPTRGRRSVPRMFVARYAA